MKQFIPLFVFAGAIGLYMTYLSPTHEIIRVLGTERDEFKTALDNVRELGTTLDILETQYGEFTTDDLVKMSRALPDTIDNLQAILDISSIAKSHNIAFTSIEVVDKKQVPVRQGGEERQELYKTTEVEFTALAPYSRFKLFLEEIEQSLQIIDLQEFEVLAKNISVGAVGNTDSLQYSGTFTIYSQK